MKFMRTKNTGDIHFRVNRHMFPEFRGVSDEDARRAMAEHSAAVDAERYKAQAWDVLKAQLGEEIVHNKKTYGDTHRVQIRSLEGVLSQMDRIYTEIEEDDQI